VTVDQARQQRYIAQVNDSGTGGRMCLHLRGVSQLLILSSSMSTAAGDSTLPLRGSNSRAALTTVKGSRGLSHDLADRQ